MLWKTLSPKFIRFMLYCIDKNGMINTLKNKFLLHKDKNKQTIKATHTKTCILILRLKPDRGLKPESAHTQPAHSLAHILENTH